MPVYSKRRRAGRPPKPPSGRKKVRAARETVKFVLPVQSFVLLPEPGPCGREGCDAEVCAEHCPKNPDGVQHEVDPARMGWARGRGDGTFDVYCTHCGEVGYVKVNPRRLKVTWG